MSTKKLNLVYDGFIRGIGDRWDTTFDPTTDMAIPNSKLIEKEIIPRYVNRALWQLFESILLQVSGDVVKFATIFPELVKRSDVITFSSGKYTLASPYLNMFALHGALGPNSKYIKILSEDKLTIVESGRNRSYVFATDNPALIKMNNALYIFPTTETTAYVNYIASPIDPLTGVPLVQNGANDMDYGYHWIDKLSQIAVDLYNKAAQETV